MGGGGGGGEHSSPLWPIVAPWQYNGGINRAQGWRADCDYT